MYQYNNNEKNFNVYVCMLDTHTHHHQNLYKLIKAYIHMVKSHTSVSIDTELKEECLKKGICISSELNKALRKTLNEIDVSSEVNKLMKSKEEKEAKELIEKKKKEKEEMFKQLEVLNFTNKDKFLGNEKPDFTDNKQQEMIDVWNNIKIELKKQFPTITFMDLLKFHNDKKVKQ